MAPRLSLRRSLIVAGILTAVAVPVTGGTAYAAASSDPNPQGPNPMATATHAPADPMPTTTHMTPTHPTPTHTHTKPAHTKPTHAKPAHSLHGASVKKVVLTTRIADVHIRSKASLGKKSKVLGTLAKPGSKVLVSCFKTGTDISGDTTWYRTVSPRGFVAGHGLDITKEPAAGVTACKVKK